MKFDFLIIILGKVGGALIRANRVFIVCDVNFIRKMKKIKIPNLDIVML